ncbi:MAG: sodium/proline symporter PutP [Sphingomonadales bacterium]|nr:sodium/proline symporter PutP [Sphingomonadales bacterium]MBD3772515.1 sodium/proline symporter PutP [Paracoccaceae bacterium]
MNPVTIATLALYFVAMLAIGIYAARFTTNDSEGYLLGGRSLGPLLAALAVGATGMSGWLILGFPGDAYSRGLMVGWLALGLFTGAFTNWIVVAPRLREQTERLGNALTIPEFLANRFPGQAIAIRVVAAVIIVVFFSVYTASGLVGGGKMFASTFPELFGGDQHAAYLTGIWLTAGVVVTYTMIGGFLAVSFTDAVQAVIMLAALILMPLVVLWNLGGPAPSSEVLNAADPGLLDMWGSLTLFGFLSAFTWGLGYFGQPHILTRFMAVKSVRAIPAARNWAMTWMGLVLLGAMAVGITGRAWVEGTHYALDDPETVFLLLARTLFSPAVTGFLLAALLAAIMSTVSSQLLVASSSLTEDFYRLFVRREASEREMVNAGRGAVLLVAVIAGVLANNPDAKVLGLVANAWAGFGAAFGPLMILSLMWRRMTGWGALAGLMVGAGTVAGWIALGWNQSFLGGEGLYEILPGFVASWIAIVVVSLATQESAQA